jgi:hypothetical protein
VPISFPEGLPNDRVAFHRGRGPGVMAECLSKLRITENLRLRLRAECFRSNAGSTSAASTAVKLEGFWYAGGRGESIRNDFAVDRSADSVP